MRLVAEKGAELRRFPHLFIKHPERWRERLFDQGLQRAQQNPRLRIEIDEIQPLLQ